MRDEDVVVEKTSGFLRWVRMTHKPTGCAVMASSAGGKLPRMETLRKELERLVREAEQRQEASPNAE